MAYTPPTADQFKTRFPEFADEDDERIEALLTEAGAQLDSTIRDADRGLAVMLMVAHTLSAGEASATGGREIASESIGPLSVSYFSGASVEWVESTGYGKQYMDLIEKNVPPILVI